jgi:23S rRNA (adenine2030-N6)-methyltransferase
MNYRHEFHAGNFADVFKHAVLARILVHLAEKPQPYRVIDTHAGAGLFDLSSAAARRTNEWRDGIGRLLDAKIAAPVRTLLAPYLDAVAACNPKGGLKFYPGSPSIALTLMRDTDRLTACELEPRASAALERCLAKDKRAKAVMIDGWTALNAYIPPRERRGLVLIDPPFEAADEFERLATAIGDATKKWPTGIYLVWFPIKDRTAEAFTRRIWRLAIPKLLRAELRISPFHDNRLTGSGLFVINPPWRLEQELRVLLPGLTQALAQPGGGQHALEHRGH